jgi:hypothetical protein
LLPCPTEFTGSTDVLGLRLGDRCSFGAATPPDPLGGAHLEYLDAQVARRHLCTDGLAGGMTDERAPEW